MKNPGTAKIDSNTALIAGSYQSINYTFTAEYAIDDTPTNPYLRICGGM